MSVEGFNKSYGKARQSNDTIVINYDPNKTKIEDVVKLMDSISDIPERHKGTVFRITPEGMWFKKIQ